MKSGLRTSFFILLVLCTVASLSAQQSATAASGSEDISGMYSFLREGEFVQINIEGPNIVSGFISRYGDTDSDKGAFLDQFFDKAAFTGSHLTFKTKPVHSVWFEFEGDVERGPGKTPNDEAYRLIRGKLTQYEKGTGDKVVARSRDVEFKSFPQDFADQSPSPSKKH